MPTIIDAPAALRMAQLSLRAVDTLAEVRSVYSGAEGRIDYGGEWWELTVVTPPMLWDDAAEVAAWCDRLRADDAVARIEMLALMARRGTTTADTITLNANAAAGGRTVSVSGLGAGATLLAGAMLHTQGDRLHRLRQGVTADGSGTASLDLFPRLRSGLSAGAVLRLSGTPRPRGLFRLQGRPGHEFDAGSGAVVQPKTLTFIEAVA